MNFTSLQKRALLTVVIVVSILHSVYSQAFERAVAIETVDVILDNKPIGKMPAGTTVEIMGEKDGGELCLIRFTDESAKKIMGLIPAKSLVKSQGEEEKENQQVPEAVAPVVEKETQGPNWNEPIKALELAKYLKANRERFSEFEGKSIEVSGVVEAMQVSGPVGALTTAEIILKTGPMLPKVRLYIHASEFMQGENSEGFEMRVQNKILEGRPKGRRWSGYYYDYWYYYDGYWRRRRLDKMEWVPIISVGQPLVGSGVISKYHIHIDLTSGKIVKE